MLDPFARFFQHCRGYARSLRVDYKDLWVVFFPRCTAGPNVVGSCCIRLHTTGNTHATIPNIVAPVCTQPYSFGIETTNTFVHFRSSLENHIRLQTKMGKVYTRFQTKTDKSPTQWGGTYLYMAYLLEYSSGAKAVHLTHSLTPIQAYDNFLYSFLSSHQSVDKV